MQTVFSLDHLLFPGFSITAGVILFMLYILAITCKLWIVAEINLATFAGHCATFAILTSYKFMEVNA
jgi:hypothetical protein